MRDCVSAADFRVFEVEDDQVLEGRVDVGEEDEGEPGPDGQELPDLVAHVVHTVDATSVRVRQQDFGVAWSKKNLKTKIY